VPDNYISVVGNLTRDPELRFTQSGTPIAHLALAVNRRRQVSGEWKTEVSFFEVRVWDQMGANICSTATKGTRVMVQGRLEQRSWEAEDGTKRSAVEIIADEIGPSMRWATATVVKSESRDAPRSPPAQQQGYPDSVTGAPREREEDIF
jgi:single-strand DNA-binding protein